MPRYSRSYRSNRFRRYRRTTLSNRSIYLKTGAKSQAVQIAALKRKINRVYKAAKPERKQKVSQPLQNDLSSNVGKDVYFTAAAMAINSGPNLDERIGDKIYRKDKFMLTFEYFNNSSTGYHDSESAGCQVRIICGRWKTPHNVSLVPTVDSVVSNYSSTGAGYTISAVAPLVPNVSEDKIIYSDKLYYMTSSDNQRCVKVSTPYFLDKYTTNDDVLMSCHSWIIVIGAGLHWDSNFTEVVQFTSMKKTVFTDS